MDWINCQDTWLNTTQIQAWAKVLFNFYMDWINCQDTWLNTTQIQAWAKVLLRDYQIEERRFRYKDAYYHDFEHKAFTDMGDKCSTM
eukprot:CAMPEP_0170509744 /NCGR_PEP_ID=MMETSP0208-20121228/65381_1 /TAXON_ID=197538 /ORGANISM="Strombidium inclinatum, Strain S3" /LENGTH=86 /DNA_ID=CAMNT_0010793135 /DNA_START=535 /DNA_END=795 /DNA_ORIENTATION=+